jgi:hypothetical protein
MLEHSAYTRWSVHIKDPRSSAQFINVVHRAANAGEPERKLPVVCPTSLTALSVYGTGVPACRVVDNPTALSFSLAHAGFPPDVWLCVDG